MRCAFVVEWLELSHRMDWFEDCVCKLIRLNLFIFIGLPNCIPYSPRNKIPLSLHMCQPYLFHDTTACDSNTGVEMNISINRITSYWLEVEVNVLNWTIVRAFAVVFLNRTMKNLCVEFYNKLWKSFVKIFLILQQMYE